MKKIFKSIVALACLGVIATGLFGCLQPQMSAYDIAVKNGFKGTEAEWLLSLNGKNGEDGEDLDVEALYEAARKHGYEGSFLDFCKTLNVEISENNDTVTIAQNVTSVVSIYCQYTKTSGGWLGQSGSIEYGSQAGSGVIVELNKEAGTAYILTNYHVVYNIDSDQKGVLEDIWVYTYGSFNGFTEDKGDETGDGMKATYVGGAMDYDIAVLKIEGSEKLKNSVATAAKMGDSNKVIVGEKTYVIGNPAGAGIAVTDGVLSVDSKYIAIGALDNRDLDKDGQVDGITFRVMQTSAAINSGNSGGGMFNAKGELIGIVNAKSAGSSMDNMGYALPITLVKNVYENLLANDGKVLQAMLGIMVETTASKAIMGEDGHLSIQEEFKVATVAVQGASSYRKFAAGDMFVAAKVNNGEVVTLTRRHQITDVLLSVRKGDMVTFYMCNSSGDETEVVITFDKDEYFKEYA